MQFVPIFGNLAFTLIAFVVALSVIVAIHEYGHYIVGRLSGIHAEVFSLGFGPVLFSRTDKHGTEWQIAALPLGGFVRFLGDANAASVGSDGEAEELPEHLRRRTMEGAPLWARSATVLAGPVFNFVLAIVIFTGVIVQEGSTVVPLTIDRLTPLPDSYASDLQNGDRLIAIEGVLVDDPDQAEGLIDRLPVLERLEYQIERGTDQLVIEGPYISPPAVIAITPRSAADDAGFRIGDVITHVDGTPIFAFSQLQELVPAANGAEIDFTVWRDGEVIKKSFAPRRMDIPAEGGGFETRWLIGVSGSIFFEAKTEAVGLWSGLSAAVQGLWNMLTTSLSAMSHIIFGQISTCNLSGPVGIAETSGSMAEQGPQSFIWFIGGLSAAVGLINLFPIPVLDGGHLVFHAYEAITRRKPSENVLRGFMYVGLSFVLTMMIFTILNDTLLCP